MTKANLSAPRAKLAWANDQINVLHAKIIIFGERKPYRVIHESNPDGAGYLVKLQTLEPVPDDIVIHIGAVLAAQRDSLDFLATALAERNGAKEPRDVHFPIAGSKQSFRERGTQKKIAKLAVEDRAIIEALKPYKGGNDMLYALNWLCQKGKHRKPLLIGGAPTSQAIGGNGIIREIKLLGMVGGLEAGAPVATVDADPGIYLTLTVDVAFREIAHATLRPVVPVLREFSSLAASIINLFE